MRSADLQLQLPWDDAKVAGFLESALPLLAASARALVAKVDCGDSVDLRHPNIQRFRANSNEMITRLFSWGRTGTADDIKAWFRREAYRETAC